MSQHSGNINPNLPGSYQPVMNDSSFAAPAHHLNTQQKEQVAELAEHSSGHTGVGQQGLQGGSSGLGSGSGHGSGLTGSSGGLGSGSGHSGLSGNSSGGLTSGLGSGITSGSGHDLRDSLAGTRTQERSGPSGGEYNLRQGDLQGSNIGVGRDAAHLEDARNKLAGVAGTSGLGGHGSSGSTGIGGAAGTQGSGGFGQGEFGNTGRAGGLSSQGDGQREAAGLGAGGLAPAAAAQGLSGPTGGHSGREAVGAHHGGVLDSSAPGQSDRGYDNSSSSSSGLGKGAAAGGVAGLAGAGAYGASSGRTGHGSNLNEAIDDASRGGNPGSGSGLSSGTGRQGGPGGDSSLLAKPTHSDSKLVGELEERAQKSGTHAAGFGSHGTE